MQKQSAESRLRMRLQGIAQHRMDVIVDEIVAEVEFDIHMRLLPLTTAERRAIKVAICLLRDRGDRTNLSTLRGLLARAAKERNA
jgi:hypothetical protein